MLRFIGFGESPLRISAISQRLVDMVFFYCDILGVADNSVSPVVKSSNHPKFVDEGVMRVKLKVVVCVGRFTVNSRIEGSVRIEMYVTG